MIKAVIVLAVLLFAITPAALIAALGFRKQFEIEVFGRLYVWDKPWVLVTQDDFVKQAYEKLQRRMILLAGLIVLLLMVVIVVVQ